MKIIDWNLWSDTVIDQWLRGEMKQWTKSWQDQGIKYSEWDVFKDCLTEN
jgi:hypothetical protein